MRFLLIARQKKNLDTFQTTIAHLLAMGHDVRVAVQEDEPERAMRLAPDAVSASLSWQRAPTARSDEWRADASLVRRLRDWLQYLGPSYTGARTLRLRVLDRLAAELGVPATAFGDGLVPGLGPAQVERLLQLATRIEAAIPSDPLHDELMASTAPDVVLVTPGVHFGSGQADFIKSARAAGIPVWMLLFSWDNLSTKGALHVAPDLLFVWNDQQRREAEALHGFPKERSVIIGAPRFDTFFTLTPALTRERFFVPLGLDASRPALLYVCSSKLVARRELGFIQGWLAALRASTDPRLRTCNVLVRPHPDIPLLDDAAPATVVWPGLEPAQGFVSRPFSDDAAVVLRTTYATPQAFFECLHHAAAVIGLNTSAELEAGIAGRPVFTMTIDDEVVTGQASTLHFHYLLREQGGFVVAAPTLEAHLGDLSRALAGEVDAEAIRSFIQGFLRPRGERPVAEVLARSLVKHARRERDARTQPQPMLEPDASTLDEGGDKAPTSDRGRPEMPRAGRDRGPLLLRVGYRDSTLRVAVAADSRKRRDGGDLTLDPYVTAWLDTLVQPNEVVYDIGASQGEYALVAAAHRNALAVAFEPGFAAFKRLCDNVILNQCQGSVVPLPIALGDGARLGVLEYPAQTAGEAEHLLRPGVWQRRPYESTAHYAQPVCVERLDDVVRRCDLPKPHHIHLRVQRFPEAVVRGAAEVLSAPSMRSILLTAPRADRLPAIEAVLRDAGLTAHTEGIGAEGAARLFVREAATTRAGSPAAAWTDTARRYLGSIGSRRRRS
jgi:FkbM family methyltransferase